MIFYHLPRLTDGELELWLSRCAPMVDRAWAPSYQFLIFLAGTLREDGADYIGVGAAFMTDTKAVGRALTRDEIIEVLQAADIPACAIGGISAVTGPQLEGLGLDGISVISSILSHADITAAARTMRDVAERIKG